MAGRVQLTSLKDGAQMDILMETRFPTGLVSTIQKAIVASVEEGCVLMAKILIVGKHCQAA